ncbi:MAG: tetratricopeptide repeat protein [Planctomycetaceae bacterium]|nr:tetratricopeptide repeat protein [Planctomycetaceae bacterium]
MGLFDRLAALFFKNSRDESLLQQGLAHAKAKRPQQALAIYTRLLDSPSTNSTTRARALFNRALAYSSLDKDQQALADLEQVLALPDVPENVQAATHAQLARVRRRQVNP